MKVNHLITKTNTEIIQYHLTKLIHDLIAAWASAALTWDTDKVHFVGATKVVEDLSKFSPLIKISATYKRGVSPNPAWVKHVDQRADLLEFFESNIGHLGVFIHGLSGGDISVYVPIDVKSGTVRAELIQPKIDGISMAHFDDSKKLLEMLITDNILVSTPTITEKWVETT